MRIIIHSTLEKTTKGKHVMRGLTIKVPLSNISWQMIEYIENLERLGFSLGQQLTIDIFLQ